MTLHTPLCCGDDQTVVATDVFCITELPLQEAVFMCVSSAKSISASEQSYNVKNTDLCLCVELHVVSSTLQSVFVWQFSEKWRSVSQH